MVNHKIFSLVNISLKLRSIPEEVDGVLVPHESPVEQYHAHENSPRLIQGDGDDVDGVLVPHRTRPMKMSLAY